MFTNGRISTISGVTSQDDIYFMLRPPCVTLVQSIVHTRSTLYVEYNPKVLGTRCLVAACRPLLTAPLGHFKVEINVGEG